MNTIRHQVEYAQRKHRVQQVATSLLVAAEQILSDLDHDRLPASDGMDAITAAGRLAVQLELLKRAAKTAARMPPAVAA